jgi:phosphoribosylaminoimidazole-succinocarboxamide synthase
MKKDEIFNEGKTKRVWSVEDSPGYVIIENKDDITKNDDPSQTKVMAGKAELATATTCAIFQLLKDAGIPVAFEKQLGPKEFLAPKVTMILLEIIWRRYAVGSFLKRHPELEVAEGELPHRFHSTVFELFLKTTGGVIKNQRGEQCGTISRTIHSLLTPMTKSGSCSIPRSRAGTRQQIFKWKFPVSTSCPKVLRSRRSRICFAG